LLEKHFPVLKDRRIALLGLAFKEGTDDMRESPSIILAQELLARGARVVGYDPIAGLTARVALPSAVDIAESLEQAIENVDAIVLVTRWEEFQNLPEILSRRQAPPLVVDGRRVFEPTSLSRYEGIGR
jgi:UDPglucose 6-dehydrogenase/GDP-mannose 6-dehydrogenase